MRTHWRARAVESDRVCIIRQSDVYELSLRREAEALRDAGYDVDVVIMREHGRRPTTVVAGVTVRSLPVSRRKGGKLRYLVDYIGFLVVAGAVVGASHLRRPYRAVQVNTMPDLLVLAGLIPKLFGAKLLVFMKEPVPELGETLFGDGPAVRAMRRAERLALRLADQTFTVTEELKQRYVDVGGRAEDITVVLNCPAAANLLSDRAAPRHEADRFTVVCHGSIEDRYGYDTILRAAAIARDVVPGLQVVIPGRGSWLEPMLDMVGALGLGDVVRYEGWVTQERLADLLASADAGIVAQKASPYAHLVFTNKMVDYWVFGLPVIASRLRAVANCFDDSVLEYFHPGDPDDLAARIVRLHREPERRDELARNGRRAEAEHGWAVQRARFLGVYATSAALVSAPRRREG